MQRQSTIWLLRWDVIRPSIGACGNWRREATKAQSIAVAAWASAKKGCKFKVEVRIESGSGPGEMSMGWVGWAAQRLAIALFQIRLRRGPLADSLSPSDFQ